jgi:hypothetical protein
MTSPSGLMTGVVLKVSLPQRSRIEPGISHTSLRFAISPKRSSNGPGISCANLRSPP